MEYRRFGNDIIARFNRGEELTEQLQKIALAEHIRLASVEALGAVDDLTVGVYDLDEKAYRSNHFTGSYEITSLTGSITTMNGQYYAHLHLSAGDNQGHVIGGHLNQARISVTCEMFIHILDGQVDREKDPETGINLLKF